METMVFRTKAVYLHTYDKNNGYYINNRNKYKIKQKWPVNEQISIVLKKKNFNGQNKSYKRNKSHQKSVFYVKRFFNVCITEDREARFFSTLHHNIESMFTL